MQGLAFYMVVNTTGFYDSPFAGHRAKIVDLEPYDDVDGGSEHTVSVELFIPPEVLKHEGEELCRGRSTTCPEAGIS